MTLPTIQERIAKAKAAIVVAKAKERIAKAKAPVVPSAPAPTIPSEVAQTVGPPAPEPTPSELSVVKDTAKYGQRMRETLRRVELTRRYGLKPQEFFQKTSRIKQEIERRKSEYATIIEGIDPEVSYRWTDPATGVTSAMIGRTLIGKLEEQYGDPLRKAEIQSQLAWQQARDITKEAHPETEITYTPAAGYKIAYPFAAAEHYRTYKKIHEKDILGTAIGTAFTPENIFGIPAAYYTLTGEKQKAFDIQIKGLHYFKTKQEQGLLGFGSYLIESPYVQAGIIAPTVGYGVTKVVPYLAGIATAKAGIVGGLAVKGIAIGTGGFLVGRELQEIHRLADIGKPGEALGRVGLLASQIVGAYGGYKLAGGREGMALAQKAGLEKGISTPLKPFISKYTPTALKNIYKNIGSQIQQYKTHFASIKFPGADPSLARAGMLSSLKTKFTLYRGKQPGLVDFKPGERGDIFLYGRKGMVSPREGLVSLQQIVGKRPDPFISYKPSIWGAYGRSWSFYQQSLLREVPTRIAVTTKVPFKITTVEGKTVLTGEFASRIGMGRIRIPSLETGRMPSEFRVTAPSVEKFLIGRAYKTTPLKFPKVKIDKVYGEPFFKEPTPTGLVSITKKSIPFRFKLTYDVTDYHLLSYLERLEPLYEPITSKLAPTHIARFPGLQLFRKTPPTVIDRYGGIGITTPIVSQFPVLRFEDIEISKSIKKLNFDIVSGLKGVGRISEYDRGLVTLTTPKTTQISLQGLGLSQLQQQALQQITVQELKIPTPFARPPPPPPEFIEPIYPDYIFPDLPPQPKIIESPFIGGIPPLSLYGRGKKPYGISFFGKIKGFRKADIWSPLGIKI